jgi:hypothetical protein
MKGLQWSHGSLAECMISRQRTYAGRGIRARMMITHGGAYEGRRDWEQNDEKDDEGMPS